MSFCENIKEEIQKADCRNKNCSLAFISGFAAFTLSVEDEKVAFLADGEEIGKKMSYLMKKQFSIGDGSLSRAYVGRGGKCYKLSYEKEETKKILSALSDKNEGSEDGFFVDSERFNTTDEMRHFVMGAFLGGGFAADPYKIYHLEFVAKRERALDELGYIFSEFGEIQKRVVRNGYYVMYFKSYDSLENILNILGAHKSMMELFNIKIEKEEKNLLNRQVNFEVANMQKTNDAATESINEIESIMYTVGLDALPDSLQEMALLRLANPEESLAGLAKLSGLSRSGVNHRLKKISEIAGNL